MKAARLTSLERQLAACCAEAKAKAMATAGATTTMRNVLIMRNGQRFNDTSCVAEMGPGAGSVRLGRVAGTSAVGSCASTVGRQTMRTSTGNATQNGRSEECRDRAPGY